MAAEHSVRPFSRYLTMREMASWRDLALHSQPFAFEPLLLKIFGMTFNGYPLEISAVTIIGDVLFGICVIMTIVSGIDYLIKGKKYLKG